MNNKVFRIVNSIKLKRKANKRAGVLITIAGCLLASASGVFHNAAYADEMVMGTSTQSVILSVENATLQNYSIEDLIATQSFILGKPYNGEGRVLDIDDDGCIDIFDLGLMKRNFKLTGNYNVLLTELINGAGSMNSTMNKDGTETTNRVVVRTTHEYDFTKYHPIALLVDNEYKYLLQFDSYEAANICVKDLQGKDGIVYAEMDEIVDLPGDDVTDVNPGGSSSLLMGEAQRAFNSWGVSTIEADKFANYLSSSFNNHITVAVVDTGVSNHSFLSGRLLNGGRDFVNGDNDPTDDQGHGTHVAGTVVDCTPNLNIDILPVKVMAPKWTKNQRGAWVLAGSGNNSQISAGIDYAVNMGVDVINLSLGGQRTTSQQIDESIAKAIKAGVTVVVSAGNDNSDTQYYCPAHISDAIVVSAIDSSLSKASFSNYGKSVDVAAPGVNIKSCLIGGIYDPDGNQYYYGSYDSWNGTSMAAPHISAAAAMIKYAGIAKSPSTIEATLTSICQDLGASGKDDYYGFGVPKLSKLIKQSVKPSITLSQTTWSGYIGDSVSLTEAISKYGTDFGIVMDGGYHTLKRFSEQYPHFCCAANTYALYFGQEDFNWDKPILVCYEKPLHLSSESSIKITYNSGFSEDGELYLINPPGGKIDVPIATYAKSEIDHGRAIHLGFEWLQSQNFITTETSCDGITSGEYYLAWIGRSDNTHPIIRDVRVWEVS